jgi:hypothetical protein
MDLWSLLWILVFGADNETSEEDGRMAVDPDG